jgi:hypothetical protein
VLNSTKFSFIGCQNCLRSEDIGSALEIYSAPFAPPSSGSEMRSVGSAMEGMEAVNGGEKILNIMSAEPYSITAPAFAVNQDGKPADGFQLVDTYKGLNIFSKETITAYDDIGNPVETSRTYYLPVLKTGETMESV